MQLKLVTVVVATVLGSASLAAAAMYGFTSVSEKEHSVSTNFTVKTEDIASFESEEECSVLTNFTMKTQDRATFEWENGNVATAYLLKEKDECIYR